MARSNRDMTEGKIAKWMRAGRGQGVGRQYKPWLTVRDVPSIGREHRTYSHTVGRIHHMLSDLEFRHFLLFDMMDDVIDIREQFPLPRDTTRHIAQQLDYRHPRQPGSTCDIVMTTDLLVTRMSGGVQFLEAYAVKPSKETQNKRVKQKLEIEERHWQGLGITFSTLTEASIPPALLKTLKWLHPAVSLRAVSDETVASARQCSENLIIAMAQKIGHSQKLPSLCTQLDIVSNFAAGAHLLAARHLIANRILITDLFSPEIWRIESGDVSVNDQLNLKEIFHEGEFDFNS